MAVDNTHVRQNSLRDETFGLWEDIEHRLTGTDFHARLRRFVGLQTWHERLGDPTSEARRAIASLAEEAVNAPNALMPEIGWLMTPEAENGYAFGYELGLKDIEWTFKSALLGALGGAGSDGAAHTLGGYLWAMLERDRDLWALEMDHIAQDRTLQIWLPEISRRTELNDHLADLILSLAREGRIAPDRLGLFAFGRSIRMLTRQMVESWIGFLLSGDHLNLTSVAFDLFYGYFRRDGVWDRLPIKLTRQLLIHPTLFGPEAGIRNNGMAIDHYWQEIAETYIELEPDRSIELASAILPSFGSRSAILESPLLEDGPARQVLQRILERHPQEVWEIILPLIEPLGDMRAWSIFQWLHGGAMSLIPRNALWGWVDHDVAKRAKWLARFVPKDLFSLEPDASLCRQLLVRYGDRDEVRRSLLGNFLSQLITGPASEHYMVQKEQLLAFRTREAQSNVRRWLDEYIQYLEGQIENAKMLEERELV